jgi:N-acetylneuraminate synthase
MIIGEVAQAHDGSLGTAHAFIDAIADVGADAVKFQTHIAEAESTLDEPWRVKFSPQDDTRYQYWKRMEFTPEQWQGLKTHAEERSLLFLSSPFSNEALELLIRIGIPAWKVASGEISNIPLLDRMTDTGLPVLLSSGMSPLTEIDSAVEHLKERQLPFAVMQCTSAYPCPPEKVGLNVIPLFAERYDCAVGLSDHSGTIYPSLASAALGVAVLEVHVTLSRNSFGPDVSASVTTEELRQLVEGVRFIEKMKANQVDKDLVGEEMADMRSLFTKSLIAKQDLRAGSVLSEADLAIRKPGTGIPPNRLSEFIGRRLRRAVKKDDPILEDDFDS